MAELEYQDKTEVIIRDVHKHYGENHVVRGVSFAIAKGEFFSLLGPSGCGKTTILRMLAGFIFPDAGEVYIGGKPMGETPPHLRESNLVFQQLALFPHMSVFDNIAYGLRLRRVAKDEVRRRVEEALGLVRLQGFGSRRIQQLSGGQQQRVAIARAIVCRPKVLLLDEPLGALDLQLRLELQTELKRIQRELGSTFVFVTHDQGEALHLSDKIAVMNEGNVVQLGSPDEIYHKPNSVFVARFIGETNLLSATVFGNEGEWVRLRLANGSTMVAAAAHPLSPGDDATVSLRHETVKLGPTAEQMPNRVPALVRDVVFRGSYTTYLLEIDGGVRISAQVPHGEAVERYAPGTRVTAGWSPSQATALKS